MADTIRSMSELQALFADNNNGNITPQKLRDFLVSTKLNSIIINSGGVQLIVTTTSANATVPALDNTITPVVNSIPTAYDANGTLQYTNGIRIIPTAGYGPNIVGGYSGNFVDPALSSSTIIGGGRAGYENKLKHYSGLVGLDFATIIGGYDNVGTDMWPGVLGGAHNRVNTTTVPTGAGADPSYFTSSAATGTISSSGTTVTGVGTAFLTEFFVGSVIYTGSGPTSYQYVASIVSDTSLTTVSAFSPAISSGTTFYCGSYYIPNDTYVPNINTDHSSILCGTFNTLYNSHMGLIAGGTKNTLGWDGTTQVAGHYAAIIGGTNNICNNSYSFIAAGYRNYVRGQYSFATGYNNSVSNNNAYNAVFGQNNVISSSGCFIAGVNNAIGTSSNYSTIFGQSNASAASRTFQSGLNHSAAIGSDYGSGFGLGTRINKYGQFAIASGLNATKGDAQVSFMVARTATGNATPTNMQLDGGSTSAGYILVGSTSSLNYTSVYFTIKIVAQQQTSTNCGTWEFNFCAIRGANAAATSIVGGNISAVAPNKFNNGSVAWTVGIQADTTNGAIQIVATGAVSTNIRWVAKLETIEVNYP